MLKQSKCIDQNYFRSMLFGFEDALVSTTGTVVGISAGTSNKSFILLAGVVTVIVEALSMGVGEYFSEKSVGELKGKRKSKTNPMIGGLVMFLSYFVAGAVPVIPTVLLSYPVSAGVSVATALVGLFILGLVKGKIVGNSPTKSGLEIMFVGGIAAIAGLIIGLLFRQL